MSSKATRKPTPAGKARKKILPLHWAVAGALLAAGVGYYVLDDADSSSQVAVTYSPEDIVYDKPFRAIHEMQGGSPIPFLAADQPQPKIALPDNYYDFGAVGAKEVVKRSFLVRNDGAAPLTISRAYTTCGCTTAEFTARIIPPGKAALVTLVFDAGFHDARGETVKRGIIIENNDRANSNAEIWTRAVVGWN